MHREYVSAHWRTHAGGLPLVLTSRMSKPEQPFNISNDVMSISRRMVSSCVIWNFITMGEKCVHIWVIAGTNTPASGISVQARGTSKRLQTGSSVDQSVALPYSIRVSGLTVSKL